jgi:hypothetical protein
MIRNGCCDDLTGFHIRNLHSPKITHIIYGIAACTIDRLWSKNARIRPYAGHGVGTRIYQIQVIAASIARLRLLEIGPDNGN